MTYYLGSYFKEFASFFFMHDTVLFTLQIECKHFFNNEFALNFNKAFLTFYEISKIFQACMGPDLVFRVYIIAFCIHLFLYVFLGFINSGFQSF